MCVQERQLHHPPRILRRISPRNRTSSIFNSKSQLPFPHYSPTCTVLPLSLQPYYHLPKPKPKPEPPLLLHNNHPLLLQPSRTFHLLRFELGFQPQGSNRSSLAVQYPSRSCSFRDDVCNGFIAEGCWNRSHHEWAWEQAALRVVQYKHADLQWVWEWCWELGEWQLRHEWPDADADVLFFFQTTSDAQRRRRRNQGFSWSWDLPSLIDQWMDMIDRSILLCFHDKR